MSCFFLISFVHLFNHLAASVPFLQLDQVTEVLVERAREEENGRGREGGGERRRAAGEGEGGKGEGCEGPVTLPLSRSLHNFILFPYLVYSTISFWLKSSVVAYFYIRYLSLDL